MSDPIFGKGHRFNGPDGQWYELTAPIYSKDRVMVEQFSAGGGAPDPVSGFEMPGWLVRQIVRL